MDYTFLVGRSQEEAVNYCKDNSLPYELLYTDDKKTKGNSRLVIAVRATAEKITLIVGRFLLKVEEVNIE